MMCQHQWEVTTHSHNRCGGSEGETQQCTQCQKFRYRSWDRPWWAYRQPKGVRESKPREPLNTPFASWVNRRAEA